MRAAQAIFGAVVAAFGVVAFVTFYDEFKPRPQTPAHPNAAAQKVDSLTPANSIAHDFAVLNTTPASSSAQELADAPKAVQTVPSRTQTPAHPNAAAQKADSLTSANSIAHDFASSSAQELADAPKAVQTVPSRTQTPARPNAAAQKVDSLTPANSIAHDFAVLNTTPASSSAQEFAVPRHVQTVPSGAQAPSHPNAAAQTADSLTPANSIAHDFAVLDTTPASSIAQELADVPKSVQTVPIGRGSALLPTLPAPAQAVAPTTPAARAADQQAAPETLLSHAEPVDVCARYGGHRADFMRGHHAMWSAVNKA